MVRLRSARLLLLIILAAWAAGILTILTHTVFVSNDSVSNYAHVWFISETLSTTHWLPYHFPEIGHGEALAYPYAFVPWTTAALLHPLLGDWVTTLWLVMGAVGVVAGAWWAFPEVRSPLAFSAVLANPMLVESLILAQLPFLWATAMLFSAVACWRRGRTAWAVILMGLAQGSHPAVVLPLAGLLVLVWLRFEPRPRRLVASYACSVTLSLPGVALVFLSPVVSDSGLGSALAVFIGTVAARLPVVFGPVLVAWLALHRTRWLPATVAAALALNLILIPVRDTTYAWGALVRDPDESLLPFIESPKFERGAVYRIMRSRDGKVGMYQLLTHGARLDSEFFPESFARHSFASPDAYRVLLRERGIDYVLIYRLFDERERTNEHALLDTLVTSGCATRIESTDDFDAYAVTTCR